MKKNTWIGVYKDTTNLFSDEECDYDNELYILVPTKELKKWIKRVWHTSLGFFLRTYTYDETQTLYHDLKEHIIEVI